MNPPSYSQQPDSKWQGRNWLAKKWRILAVLSIAELLGMSLWMTANAVSPQLAELWKLNESQAVLLTTVVQIGFVFGTALAAILNLADVLNNRFYFVVCAILGAIVNGLLLIDQGFVFALVLRFLTGFFLAGVYPPAMKMVATWFQSSRGLAIGTLIGALVIGKAAPYLIKVFGGAQWQIVIVTTSIFAILSALIVLLVYRDGPHAFQKKPFSISLVGEIFQHKATRLAIFGYLGHMWELYAMWIWLPVFLGAAAVVCGVENQAIIDLISFSAIAAGAAGCVWGGRLADKMGRAKLVNICMVCSGLCCLVIGLAFGMASPFAFGLMSLIAVVWGFFVVADSAQFSTMVTEVAPPHAVGTALTLQTSLGFCLTVVTIQAIAILEPMVGWQFAFAVLAIGPLFGVISIVGYSRETRT